MKVYSLALLCLILSLKAPGQTFLYLKKLGGKQAIKYNLHEEIRFQMKGQSYFTSGKIQGFGEDHIVIHETKVLLTDIQRFDIRNKSSLSRALRASSQPLIVASILLPLADFTNRTVVSGEEASMPHKSVWFASLGLVATSISFKLLAPKYFEPGPKRKVLIVTKEKVKPSPEQEEPQ